MKFYNDTQIMDISGEWCKRIDFEKLMEKQNQTIVNQSDEIRLLTNLTIFQSEKIKLTYGWIQEAKRKLKQRIDKTILK